MYGEVVNCCHLISGLAIAAAVGFGYSNIFVTSPSPENLHTLFDFVFKVKLLKLFSYSEMLQGKCSFLREVLIEEMKQASHFLILPLEDDNSFSVNNSPPPPPRPRPIA